MLYVQKFISENSDWEELLQEKPYCITISRDKVFGHNLVMFKYSQPDSDFNNQLVRECRGLILDEDTLEPVCVPFFKFGNFSESYVPDIDWSSAFVSQKLDGSLLKLVRIGDDILWSTNGTIDAYKAPLMEQLGCNATSFGELAWLAVLENYRTAKGLGISDCIDHDAVNGWLKTIIRPGFTYMFELTSPYNRVVVRFNETRLNFIGCRDNCTLKELKFYEHELAKVFNIPKVYPLKTLDDCIKAASELGSDEEGFVVCDKDFNRVKVKSALYCSIHHLRGENGVMSYKRALEIIKANEQEEVLTYFPEHKSAFDELTEKFNLKVAEAENAWKLFKKESDSLPTRKDQAIWILSHCKEFSGFLFQMLDGKITDMRSAIWSCPNDKIIRMLGFKD